MRPRPIAGRPITGSLRGCLVGLLVGALAVAAHGVAGGGFPDSTDLALLLIVSALTGAGAAQLGNGRVRTRPVDRIGGLVLGPLTAGQLAGHMVLSGLADGHAHATGSSAQLIQLLPAPVDFAAAYVPGGWMLVAHIVATLGCGALIPLAERLYAVASSVLRAVVAAPHLPVISSPIHWSNPGLSHYRIHPKGAIGPRAPPVHA